MFSLQLQTLCILILQHRYRYTEEGEDVDMFVDAASQEDCVWDLEPFNGHWLGVTRWPA